MNFSKFYSEFRNAGITVIENAAKPTVAEQFLGQYEEERKLNPDLSEDELFEKAVKVLEEHGIIKRRIVS